MQKFTKPKQKNRTLPESGHGGESLRSLDSEMANLWPGQSLELLKALHIVTRDGRMNQDSRRKLKQVQHLIQFITPHLEGVQTVADLGAGKSYLGFMLYDLWMRDRADMTLYAIEQRKDLIDQCRLIATQSGFDRARFVHAEIGTEIGAETLPETLDAVLALHACDTATDAAIAFALKRKARFIALVPCCQAEVARLFDSVSLHDVKPKSLASLWSQGLHRREFGSHVTNVIRALFLEAQGYKVRVTELVGWEHSMKNELIIAERKQLSNGKARKELEELLQALPLDQEPHRMRLFDWAAGESQ